MSIFTNGKSWKTTLSGIGAFLSGAALIAACFFVPGGMASLPLTVPAGTGLMSTGIGLINAKDNNVTTAVDGTNQTVKK